MIMNKPWNRRDKYRNIKKMYMRMGSLNDEWNKNKTHHASSNNNLSTKKRMKKYHQTKPIFAVHSLFSFLFYFFVSLPVVFC